MIELERETSKTTITMQWDGFAEYILRAWRKGSYSRERFQERVAESNPPGSYTVSGLLNPSSPPRRPLNHDTEYYELPGAIPLILN